MADVNSVLNNILGRKPKRDKLSKNDAYAKEYVDYDKTKEALERQEKETWKNYQAQKLGRPRKARAK